MSKHLSSEQISDWMAGERSSVVAEQAAQHVHDCGECAAEIERLTESLAMFRVAVRETAGTFTERQRVFGIPKRRVAVLWATAAAALVTLAIIPVYQGQQNRHKAEIARQDAVLMEQVNAGLSENVASPLKPLEKMVSWGPNAKTASETRTN
jgi:hypothetical protein